MLRNRKKRNRKRERSSLLIFVDASKERRERRSGRRRRRRGKATISRERNRERSGFKLSRSDCIRHQRMFVSRNEIGQRIISRLAPRTEINLAGKQLPSWYLIVWGWCRVKPPSFALSLYIHFFVTLSIDFHCLSFHSFVNFDGEHNRRNSIGIKRVYIV